MFFQGDDMVLAYSYLRFSHPAQAKGKSIQRQTKLRDAWLARHPDVTLDLNLRLPGNRKLEDRGLSGFRRKGADRYALTAFKKLAEEGDIPSGSYLIVENLDRLSREEIMPATYLFLGIVMAGIRIVQLEPEEVVFDAKSKPELLSVAIGELRRGHSESAIKSVRSREHWTSRQDTARSTGEPITTRCPGWLAVKGRVKVGNHVKGGRFVKIPERVAIVQRMFKWACEGLGAYAIVKRLTEAGVKPFRYAERWSKGVVHRILTGRAVLGEHQPRKLGRADGAVIPDYYPRILDEETWQRAQLAVAQRKERPGRTGSQVASLFTGLLRDAHTGGRLLIANQHARRAGQAVTHRILISAEAIEGAVPWLSFPYPVFENAILRRLREINPADVTGEEPQGEAVALAAELAAHRARTAEIAAELEGDEEPVPALVRALKARNDREKELAAALAAAQQKEALPQSQAWAQAQTLLQVAQDEAGRLRLRGLLQTIIEEAWVLIVKCAVAPSWRWCAVQFHFHGGGRRDYLIGYQSAARCRSGGWLLADETDTAKLGELDLRERADVDAASAQLAELMPSPG